MNRQVNMSATVQSVMTDGGYTAQTRYAYSRAATEDMDALAINADLRYEKTESEEQTTTAGGTLELISGDSATDYTMELECVQSLECLSRSSRLNFWRGSARPISRGYTEHWAILTAGPSSGHRSRHSCWPALFLLTN